MLWHHKTIFNSVILPSENFITSWGTTNLLQLSCKKELKPKGVRTKPCHLKPNEFNNRQTRHMWTRNSGKKARWKYTLPTITPPPPRQLLIPCPSPPFPLHARNTYSPGHMTRYTVVSAYTWPHTRLAVEKNKRCQYTTYGIHCSAEIGGSRDQNRFKTWRSVRRSKS